MPGGRPRKYESAEEMQGVIDDYFNSRTPDDPVTISGMMYHLDFVSRQSFYDYEKHGEFAYILKKARQRVEMYYERMAQRTDGQVTGPIFALKQFGWTDKTEQAVTFTNKPSVKFEFDGNSGQDRPAGSGDAEGAEGS
jgi:hypothetical protein